MNCQELQDHYELFALGIAEEPERSEIRAHLDRDCEACMAGVKRALELAAMIGGSSQQSEPSRQLRRRILASAGVEQFGFRWRPLWIAATAMSLVVAVYLAIDVRREAADTRQLRAEMAQQANAARTEAARIAAAFAILQGPETKEASFGDTRPKPPRGKVFLNPAQGVLLIASNLPPAPSGKLYEMWVIPKSGKPAPAGMFQSQTDGSAMHVRQGTVDVASTGAIAVTVENEAGADQPTSQPLIVAPIESSPR